MKLLTPIPTTRLLDAADSRRFAGLPSERRVYGLGIPTARKIGFLTWRKVGQAKYFISRGFVEGLAIDGSGQFLDTIDDGVLGVKIELTRQLNTYGGEDNPISYLTGKYSFLSAALFMSRADDLPQSSVNGGKSTHVITLSTTNADGDFLTSVGGGFAHFTLDPTLNF